MTGLAAPCLSAAASRSGLLGLVQAHLVGTAPAFGVNVPDNVEESGRAAVLDSASGSYFDCAARPATSRTLVRPKHAAATESQTEALGCEPSPGRVNDSIDQRSITKLHRMYTDPMREG